MRLWVIWVVAGAAAVAAQADWNVGDRHKMHYPQLPDPYGWDVDITTDFVWDDWRCSGSGAVDDIHFWGSWLNDSVGMFQSIVVEIWSDVPAGAPNNPLPYSHPGAKLWQHYFLPNEWTMRGPYTGQEGWLTPARPPTSALVLPQNHVNYWQYNLEHIANPFIQQEGAVYWLGLHVLPTQVGPQFGWKTSLNHWNDDAAYYWFWNQNQYGWTDLHHPYTTNSLDMAFVITPEPATLCWLLFAILGLLRRR
jgi:hypothetical protein